MLKRISVGLLAIIICAFCLELGERFEIPGVHSFVSTAEAGVARRSARRRCRRRPQERATVCGRRVLLGQGDPGWDVEQHAAGFGGCSSFVRACSNTAWQEVAGACPSRALSRPSAIQQ